MNPIYLIVVWSCTTLITHSICTTDLKSFTVEKEAIEFYQAHKENARVFKFKSFDVFDRSECDGYSEKAQRLFCRQEPKLIELTAEQNLHFVEKTKPKPRLEFDDFKATYPEKK